MSEELFVAARMPLRAEAKLVDILISAYYRPFPPVSVR